MNLNKLQNELSKGLFVCSKETQKVKEYHADDHNDVFAKEEHFKNQHFSMSFFDGDSGKGLGFASNRMDRTNCQHYSRLEANQ
jgi:hypothetical protein